MGDGGEPNGGGEELGFFGQGPGEELPELPAFAAFDAQMPDGAEKDAKRGRSERDANDWLFEVAKEGADALVGGLGREELAQEPEVAVAESFDAHLGDDIGAGVGVVAGGLAAETDFEVHALDQAGARRRLKLADHGGDDAAGLDEVGLGLEAVLGDVVVEADDEAGSSVDFDAGGLEFVDVAGDVTVAVLAFVCIP